MIYFKLENQSLRRAMPVQLGKIVTSWWLFFLIMKRVNLWYFIAISMKYGNLCQNLKRCLE
ncbi:hypothetical protein AOG25_09675 [Vibrio alginolyticus]|nr:hypothetical protein AOG25_09675 [Vibrio alginolyticus]